MKALRPFRCALLAVLVASPAWAAPTKVKLATLVPDGSVWHKILRDMGESWSRETEARVTLLIYPGGVAGDEPDMVRKMRIGQIQAAALTTTGLSAIDDAFQVFAIPMFFNSYEELFHVLKRMEPTLRQRLEAKGFVLLNWGHGGWVHFFTKRPIESVDDLKRSKIFAWAGDDRMVQIWKNCGFHPVALAATDILPGLQTGMIDALPAPPLAANAYQWFRSIPNMADIGLGPLVGGLVVTRQTWSRISGADQSKLIAACRLAERRLEGEVPRQDTTSVVEMKKRGLQVTHVKGERAAEWRATAEVFAGRMKGGVVPQDILEMAVRERNAFRQQEAGGGR